MKRRRGRPTIEPLTDKEKKSSSERMRDLFSVFKQALTPPPQLDVAEWSDKYRVLPSDSSSEPGKWRTSRFPFLREIMWELSPESSAQQIAVQKGAQVGFTECAINWMFHTMDVAPAPMLYCQKTLDAVDFFSLQRLTPSIQACPQIANKIAPEKSRDSGNTKRIKKFPGGILRLGGANSGASLRSMPIQNLVLDEEDSYEHGIEDEGSPSEIAIRRTANFPNRKIFRLSTPKIKETSMIEPLFEQGDRRRYHIPCPFCKHLDYIRWENIKYEDDDPTTAQLLCTECGTLIDESYKTWMFAEENGAKWIAENPDGLYPSFHLSSLYSPVGFYSWADAVKLWLRAQKELDKEILKVFINTVLGETWSETGRTIEAQFVSTRKEIYKAEVPKEVMLLTCGVDVQEERIEAEVVGWGRNQESWAIDYAAFRGDTEHSFVWQSLHDYLIRQWQHESGVNVYVACTAVDSGHRARVVYNFCKPREFMRVFPIKGYDGWGKGLISRPNKRNRDGVFLFQAFVDELKSKVYSQLRVDEPGPGYCHFPDKPCFDTQYYSMLTSERLITKRVKGHNRLQWELPNGKRNEALDCRGYNIAALNILNPNFDAIGMRGGILGTQAQSLAPRRKKKRILSAGVA